MSETNMMTSANIYGDYALAFKNLRQDDLTFLDEVEDVSKVSLRDLCSIMDSSSRDQLTHYLPQMTPKQREGLLDLTIWQGDHLSLERISFWFSGYFSLSSLETKSEFVTRDVFLVSLSQIVKISAFDIKDPVYPPHDNFFTTEDDLLLVEVLPGIKDFTEIKELLKVFYYVHGPDKAYLLLADLMHNTQMEQVETEFVSKSYRLKEQGYPSDMEVLNRFSPFFCEKYLKHFIKQKLKNAYQINEMNDENNTFDAEAVNELLDRNNKGNNSLSTYLTELSRIELDVLKFDFFNLINSAQLYQSMLKYESVTEKNIEYVENCIKLGMDYLDKNGIGGKDESLFKYFNFSDIFKIGRSLIMIVQRELVKEKDVFLKNKKEDFLGPVLGKILDQTLRNIPRILTSYYLGNHDLKDGKNASGMILIDSLKSLEEMRSVKDFLANTLKMALSIENSHDLKEYINFERNEINFENILITQFIQFSLNKNNLSKTLGIQVSDFLLFVNDFFIKDLSKNGEEINILNLNSHSKVLDKNLEEFFTLIGEGDSDDTRYLNIYMKNILTENLNGYSYTTLESDQWKHVGGVVLI